MFFRKRSKKKKEEKKEQSGQTKRGEQERRGTTRSTSPRKKGQRNSSPIEKLTAPASITEKKVLQITASGHFPDAAWSLEKGIATVRDNTILISVIGNRKKGVMAAQVLVPFQTTVKVKGLEEGEYTIKADKGPAKPLKLQVTK